MPSFDPYGADFVADPFPTYAALRADDPVHRIEGYDAWALSLFADVKAALGHHERFCSAQGLMVIRATADFEAPHFPPGNLLLMDPPEHTAYRRLVSTRFLQRDVQAREAVVRATAHALVDGFVERGRADLVTEYAVLLPAMIFGDILGIPKADIVQFQQWSAQLVAPAPTAEAMEAHREAEHAVADYFAHLLRVKRADPRDDLLSEVATGDVGGAPIGDAEFVGFAISMLIAGNDTTSNAIANGAHLLATHPAERARLVQDPSLIADAVEEVLRYDPPVHGLARTLTTDVTLHGRTMHTGEKVLLLFAAANRDEREFGDGETFRVTRRPNGHLAFGFGIHHCVGLHLGRLEARVALDALVSRLGDWVEDEPPRWRQAIPTRPMLALPVTFVPGPAAAV